MTLPRRRFLHLAAGTAALPVLPRIAKAQAYPTRPVRLLVGFAAGGPNDIIARLIGQWLSERLGQQIVVENRPGASSNIAAEAVVRAPPDGYTLYLAASTDVRNMSLFDNLRFNFIHDIAPVASIMRQPNAMLVNPSLPAKSVPEFIAYAKANPGKINMASSGKGSASHVGMDGPTSPSCPLDHKIECAIRITGGGNDDHGDRSRSSEKCFSSSRNRRGRSCGPSSEVAAIGCIAVLFEAYAGVRRIGSLPHIALLGA
jgi:hypothetical protein